MLKLGIVGFPQVGKKTVFRLLTGAEGPVGVAKVRDPRLEVLNEMFNPKKKTPAEIQLHLFGDIQPDQALPANWVANLREMNAIGHVVRCFEDESVFHVLETVDPARDIERLSTDLLITDLVIATSRQERLQKDLKKGKDPKLTKELEIIERCIESLENEKPLTTLGLKADEEKMLRGFQFLSLKPMLVVLNGSEEPSVEIPANAQSVFLNASEELEIAQLDTEEERTEFLKELGITEPAIDRLSRQAYALLGLISFFTVGDDEVRAWSIPAGTLAPEAGGEIHSDIERGFIRAEVIKYDHLVEAGSEHKAKEAGHASLKGKDYPVEDGDVIHFRFNV